ncbi:MAG: hypothetical protein LBN42_00710 [Oscillospiraceae bacterium]|jgi:hypothetical protein|nr:hypothetical protein [Oscillospiraceae bacterium]
MNKPQTIDELLVDTDEYETLVDNVPWETETAESRENAIAASIARRKAGARFFTAEETFAMSRAVIKAGVKYGQKVSG